MTARVERYVVEVDTVDEKTWNEILGLFDDATLHSTWAFGAVRWGEKNLCHLVLKESDTIIAASQIVFKKFPFINTGLAYVSFGPLWMRKNKPLNYEALRFILRALRDEFIIKRGLILRIIPNIFTSSEGAEKVTAIFGEEGFIHNRKSQAYRTLILDMDPSIEDIYSNIRRQWKQCLNKAKKADLSLHEGADENMFQTYRVIHRETYRRKRYSGYSGLKEYVEIQKRLPEEYKMKIAICEKEGRLISGAVWSEIGNTGLFLFCGTTEAGLHYGGSYLLVWHMIEMMKQRGLSLFDQGGINPEKNPSTYQFKSGLRGTEVCQIGTFDDHNSKYYFLFKDAGHVVSMYRYIKGLLQNSKKAGVG